MATWEELAYALRYDKTMYIVKMCDKYSQVRTRGLLDNRQFKFWQPGAPIPDTLAEDIARKVRTRGLGSPQPSQARASPPPSFSSPPPSLPSGAVAVTPGQQTPPPRTISGTTSAASDPPLRISTSGSTCSASLHTPSAPEEPLTGSVVRACVQMVLDHAEREQERSRQHTIVLAGMLCGTAIASVVVWAWGSRRFHK